MKLKQSQPSLQQVTLQKPHPPSKQMVLGEWRDGERAPIEMARGDAVVDGNMAYFMGVYGETCYYNSTTKRWSMLPQSPYKYRSLVVIGSFLTAIGGCKVRRRHQINKLHSIIGDEVKKWVEYFPPMPTKRDSTAAVTTKQYLIVAGGRSGSINYLDTVEVMTNQTQVWSTATSLPFPYSDTSATICGDHLYMLGGWDKGFDTKSVLTCSLTKLLQSCSETLSDPVWCRITDVPVCHSTCAAVNGELVAVGGRDEGKKSTTAVHKYNPTTNTWDLISNMSTARCECLVAVLPTNGMIVVGGLPPILGTNEVEIVDVTYIIV